MVNIVDSNVISDIINISNEIYFNTLIDEGIEKQDQLFRNDRAKGWFIDRIKRMHRSFKNGQSLE